jgi:hypothetical protein
MNGKIFFHLMLAGVLACGMSGCANRGKLKSPSQIAAAEAKKERKRAKAAAEESEVPSSDQGAEPESK